MAMKLTNDDDGISTTTPSFYSLLHDQDFNVGTVSDLKLRNDITMGLDMNRKALIDREIEKMKIKEEFLTYGHLKHRRKLEEEALNELIVSQPSLHGLTSNWLDAHVLDERISLSNERLPLGNCSYDNFSGGLPFQRHPGFTSGVACKPVIDLRKTMMPQQPKTATSDDPLAGSKRKFEMPTIEIANRSKQTQIGWSCELCQVNVTSEQLLKSHLNGKKHTSKEKTVQKIQNNQCNIGFGNEHMKILDASSCEQQHSESSGGGSGNGKRETQDCNSFVSPILAATSNDTLAGSKRKFEMATIEIASNSMKTQIGWNCELCQVNMNSEEMLKNHLNGKKHKSKENTVQKIQNIGFGNEHVKTLDASSPEQQHSELNGWSGDGKQETQECSKKIDTDFLFWCTMCEVGTTDEASMEAHRTGEKHMRLLKEKGTLKTTMQDDLHLSRNDTAFNVLGAEAIEEKETRDLCTMEDH